MKLKMPIVRASNGIIKDKKFSSEDNEKWREDFFFVQAADTQLGYINLLGTKQKAGVPYPHANWDREVELCRMLVQKMNLMNPKPAFFVICGDLVDAYPDQFPEVRDRQIADLRKVLADLDDDIPTVCVCGNHDIGDTPTHHTIQKYNKDFGDDYFSFWFKGVLFIALNSQFFIETPHVEDLKQVHTAWLNSILQSEEIKKATHVVMFQHVPWFLDQWDEPNIYMNVRQSRIDKRMVITYKDEGLPNVLLNVDRQLREEMLQKFYEAGVRKIFCGHAHRNGGGFYKDLEVVVTTAVGIQLYDDDHGVRVVRVSEDKIDHTFYKIQDIPASIN